MTRGPAGEVGWRVRAGSLARWAGFGRGPKARRWPGKREMEIFVFIFKEISKSSFQIPF